MKDSFRLFLIEDDEPVALVIRRTLERAGHHVTCCRSGADALIVLAHSRFDLVLLDRKLGDMDGLELLETLNREGLSIPVLVITGHGDELFVAKVLRAGALDYLVKDRGLAFLVELPKRAVESVTRYRLQQQNELYTQAMESARDGILITDLQATILNVNRALEKMTGRSRQDLIGQTPRLLLTDAEARKHYAHIWETVLGRSSWQGELTCRHRDGTTFEASLTVSPIVDDMKRMTHCVAILRDVTQTRQLERQLHQAQKMQSVGTLAGGVAHEFNNLLAGINGYAALGLREGGLTESLRTFLQHVVDLSERAAGLTRQLLAFARKPALSRRHMSLADLVRSSADLISRTLHQEVKIEIDPAQEAAGRLTAEADSNQLQHALINLALNARDAIRQREQDNEAGRLHEPVVFRLRPLSLGTEYVAFPQHVPPGEYAVVEIEDHGCGMTPEVLSRALDPFYTTKDVGQGTGLGLPTVFGIVQAHQGYLTINSAVGRGTTVAIHLPRLPTSTEVGKTPSFDSEVVEPESAPGRSILVIDDEEAVLDVMRRFLEIAGHEVHCVTSGTDAVASLDAGRPADLVVLDLMMPRENSALTFERLRERRPDLPVLLCTGLAVSDPAPELAAQPNVGLLRKPFRMNELWYAVRQALEPG